MATNPQSTIVDRKQIIFSSLCKYLNLDSKTYIADAAEHDVKSVCSNILKSSGKSNDEVLSWVAFADSFPLDSKTCLGSLGKLNEELASKSVLGDGLKPSAADVIVFSAVHSAVVGLSSSARQKLPHVLRWMDYIQNKVNFGESFEKISLEKAGFEPHVLKSVARVEVDSNAKKAGQTTKVDEKQGEKNSKKTDDQKVSGKKEATKEKKKSAEPEKKKSTESEASDKDKELSVSLLNIKVGLIRKAWKHPSADSLLVEEIDVGEAKLRQVVSGLAKFCSPEELTNRRVVLITNVKPGKLRDVMSEGLVLCASNEDHSVVEPLLPPEGSKVGEQVTFSGIDGKPEDVLNPKKKQLEKITPNLYTDEKGVATFKGLPFMTSGGPCTSSIPKASIK